MQVNKISCNSASTQGEIVVHGGLADSWQWDLTVQVNKMDKIISNSLSTTVSPWQWDLTVQVNKMDKVVSNSLSTTVSPWQWNLTAQVNQMDKIISNSVSTRIFYTRRDTNTE